MVEKDIRMGNIFPRWARKFYDGQNIFTMGARAVPTGEIFLRWANKFQNGRLFSVMGV